MRKSFFRSFGHSWAGRRLARTAWTPFRSALLDGEGIAVALARATEAAENRNHKTLLVARWATSRIERVVRLAAQNAANTD